MRRKALWLLSTLAVCLVLLAFTGQLLFARFVAAGTPTEDVGDLPPTAIIFTGQFERIELGLALLEAGKVSELFITGVNPTAGLRVTRFADTFTLTAEQRAQLVAGTITLAPDARTTLENALETACWLAARPPVEAVTLITSPKHMARAAYTLEHVIAPVRVVRVVSAPSATRARVTAAETLKFAAMQALLRLPPAIWPATQPANCLSG